MDKFEFVLHFNLNRRHFQFLLQHMYWIRIMMSIDGFFKHVSITL